MHTQNTRVKDEPFFFYFSWVILFLVIISFGGKALFDADGMPPITRLHHFHAVAMMAWLLLFAIQPTLIRAGHYSAHRLLGKFSVIVVIIFFGFAISISMLNWDRTGQPLIVTVNALNLLLFTAFYVSAIMWRTEAAKHKRLMLYATLSLMGPATGRLPEIFDITPFASVPIMFSLQLAAVVHDKMVHRKVHKVSWIGFAVFLITIPVILTLSESSAWNDILVNVLGTPSEVLKP